jgi:hypothetical protein
MLHATVPYFRKRDSAKASTKVMALPIGSHVQQIHIYFVVGIIIPACCNRSKTRRKCHEKYGAPYLMLGRPRRLLFDGSPTDDERCI